ncbi:MAG: very short patch repair endonuclease [Patescibacteria group bacterium]|jgi:DNA mismatch endonuclease (patch repair protein)
MTDIFSKKKRSEIMAKVRYKDSAIEIAFRKALWHKGYKYRKNSTKYFGKPDLVLAKHKTVIFIDSCFWHGCPKHYSLPTTRKKFWRKKLLRNRERDREVNKYYKRKHWHLIRIWEHSIINNLDKIIKKTAIKLN